MTRSAEGHSPGLFMNDSGVPADLFRRMLRKPGFAFAGLLCLDEKYLAGTLCTASGYAKDITSVLRVGVSIRLAG